MSKEQRERIKQIALINAVSHAGKAQQDPVIGKILAETPSLRAKIKEIIPLVAEIIEEINKLSLEDQKKLVGDLWTKTSSKKKKAQERKLPALPNIRKYETVVTRFSPNPDAPIHLGSARAIILCHEYARMYSGKFLVRFEDTDPKLKQPKLPFYNMIEEDLSWLNCKPDECYFQSDRLPIYYAYTEKLIIQGNAYICNCKPHEFKKLIEAQTSCPCRNLSPKEQMRRWQKMQDGTYKEREVVVRVRTDLTHPNPAVRDWPAMRIINTKKHPHPRVGSKYRVWPLYNLACGIDDHLLGITHIIRGKEHLTNQTRQEYIYRYFGWKYPEAIHYGRMKITGASLSKSKIVQGMREGIYQSWDDPRLATFAALRRRGIEPEAIRQLIIDVGPKSQDLTLSWENLYAHNRKLVEPTANRYFFISNPLKMIVRDIQDSLSAKVALHPDHPERGFRQFLIEPHHGVARAWVSKKDADNFALGQVVRLMGAFNIKITSIEKNSVETVFHSKQLKEARELKAPLIHWIPEHMNLKCRVVMPSAQIAEGLAEDSCTELEADTIVQFERFGFVRIDSNEKQLITAYYCHR